MIKTLFWHILLNHQHNFCALSIFKLRFNCEWNHATVNVNRLLSVLTLIAISSKLRAKFRKWRTTTKKQTNKQANQIVHLQNVGTLAEAKGKGYTQVDIWAGGESTSSSRALMFRPPLVLQLCAYENTANVPHAFCNINDESFDLCVFFVVNSLKCTSESSCS